MDEKTLDVGTEWPGVFTMLASGEVRVEIETEFHGGDFQTAEAVLSPQDARALLDWLREQLV